MQFLSISFQVLDTVASVLGGTGVRGLRERITDVIYSN